MFPKTPAQWEGLLRSLGVRPTTAERFAEPFAEEVRPELFNLGEAELDDYLAEILHESNMLESLEENLNYSAKRINELGKMYPNGAWGRAAKLSSSLANNPQGLAEIVYGGRMGNRRLGDGWRFRGQGLPMITGADNFRRVGELMGQDLLSNPELLQQPRFALEASILWWRDAIPDSAVDHPERVRKLVQGGELGLDHTRKLVAIARAELNNQG